MTDIFITLRDNVNLHRKELALVPFVLQNWNMADEHEYPFWEQGRRLRWLRQAERRGTGTAFAEYVGWGQSGYSQFETGKRRVPADKALQLRKKIVGFDPLWLWEGDKRGLSYDLRVRIEAEEAKEPKGDNDRLASDERQDV
jgi:transcriptional regulator with XRE-family HTH domain